MSIAARLGAQSGMDVADAEAGALTAIKPWLLAVELLKVVTGALIAFSVFSTTKVFRASALSLCLGLIGAALLVAAGALGFLAVDELGRSNGSAELGRWTALSGLASAPFTGVWAAALLGRRTEVPKWLRLIAFSLAATGLGALLLPPIGMLFGLASIAWWFGLARLLGRTQPRS